MYEKPLLATLTLTTLVGSGKMLETTPVCPSAGTYTGAGIIPAIGTAYLTCNYETGTEAAHIPSSTSGW
jgi:hypothetical protein